MARPRGFTKENNPQRSNRSRPNPLPAKAVEEIAAASKRGRPCTYNDGFPEVVYRLRLMNNTLEEIAFHFGVNETTIKLWREKYPDFNTAYSEGGELADFEVTQALKHVARGYSHKAEKIFLNKEGEIVRAEYTQHYPPSVPAASLWLANRQRDKWKLPNVLDKSASDAEVPAIKIIGGLPDE